MQLTKYSVPGLKDLLRAGRPRVRNPVGEKIFLTRPDRLREPTNLLYNKYFNLMFF